MRGYRIGRLKGRFVVTWDDGGTRRRYRLDALTAKDAEREARDLILSKRAPPGSSTIADLWAAYARAMDGRRQATKLADAGKHVLPAFGHLLPSQITDADCDAYISQRRGLGRKDGTIRTEMGCLRAALLWAHKGRMIERLPAINMPPVPRPRERYLTRAEVAALLDAAEAPHIRLAMMMMLTTAARSGAVFDLTWDRVDMQRRIIRLAPHDIGPKKGRATVPINDSLAEALTEAKQAALTRYVIEWGGKPVSSIKTGFNAAVTRAGIAHCTPHDLRRTAGRFMAEAGVPIEEIAQYLGHSDPHITRATYAQFSPDYLRKAAGALEL